VNESVVRYHDSLLSQVFEDAPKEGWERILVVGEQERDLEIVLEV